MPNAERLPGWKPDDSTFGARLALVRHACGWNVKEAALACGLPFQSWRNWEMNGRLPRDLVGTCQRIADHTGVDVAWLAGLPRKDSNLQPAGYGMGNEIFDWSVPSCHDPLRLAA